MSSLQVGWAVYMDMLTQQNFVKNRPEMAFCINQFSLQHELR